MAQLAQSIARPEPIDLQDRVERLEASQRRLRRTSLGLGVCLAATGLMSLAVPAVCKTVRAERFVLEDSHGNERVVLDAYAVPAPILTLQDEDGEPIATIQEEDGGLQLKLFGAEPRTIPIGGRAKAKGGVH